MLRRTAIEVLLGAPGWFAGLVSGLISAAQPSEFVILTTSRLGLAEWKWAIEAQDYLVRLVLDEAQPEAVAGRWHAVLEGEPVVFRMRDVPLPPDEGSTRYLFAFSISERLETRSEIAAAMSALAYGIAAGGALYLQESGRTRALEPWASDVDIHAALGLGKREECAARYPGRVRLTSNGGALVTTVHRD